MASLEMTNMGGAGESFPSTNWRGLSTLKKADQPLYNSLINHLISLYWKPVYCFLRNKGYPDQTAKDLTQDFFYEVILKKGLLEKVDQGKGRLRTFLLKCLHHFTINCHRKENALKNHPQQSLVQLDDLEEPSNLLKSPEMSPDQIYQISWVQQSLQATRQYCEQNGQNVHWQIFESQFLRPIIEHSPRPSQKALCEQYDLNDEKQVSNTLTTVKRTLRRIFYERLKNSLKDPSDLGMETREFLKIFE